MADLTSLYKNKHKRDFSIQACADCINKIALQFPMEFKVGFFTDYFDIAGGTQPPKSTFIYEPRENYVKFLQIRDFSSDSTPTFIPVSKNNKICNEDDLVLGRYGASVGKILTGKTGAYNVACAKIIFLEKKEIDKDFLFYWLHSSYFQNYLTTISRSAQGGFNKNDLSRIKTYFPSNTVQKNLTSILKSIDTALLNGDKIEFNKKGKSNIEVSFIELVEKFLSFINEGEAISNELTNQLTLVKKLRQSFLQEAVQGKLVEQNPDDEPASELLKKIKAEKEKLIAEKKLKKEKALPPIQAEEIPFEIPEGWVWCRLREICLKITDGTHFSPTNLESGDFKYITAKNIKDSGIDLTKISYVTEEVHKEIYSRCNPEYGDILYIKDGATTGVVTINNLREEFSMLSSVALIKLPTGILNRFLMHLMRSPFYYNFTRGDMSGVAITRITIEKIQKAIIPLPPLSEQIRIVQKLDELMQTCDELEASIKESQSQNEKLLQQVLREALRK
jgi:type I restriction enzyme S subunit